MGGALDAKFKGLSLSLLLYQGWHLGGCASKMTRPQETGSLGITVSELGAKVKISGSLSPSLPIIHLLLGKDDEI